MMYSIKMYLIKLNLILIFKISSNPRAYLQGDGCNKHGYGIMYVYMHDTPCYI